MSNVTFYNDDVFEGGLAVYSKVTDRHIGYILSATYHSVSGNQFFFEPNDDQVLTAVEMMEIVTKLLQLEASSPDL